MEVPSLPSDNLYKLGTFCGMLLIVAGVVLDFQAVAVTENTLEAMTDELNKFDVAELERTRHEHAELVKRATRIAYDANAGMVDRKGLSREELEERLTVLQASMRELEVMQKEQDILNATVQAMGHEVAKSSRAIGDLSFRHKNVGSKFALSKILAFSGAFILVIGVVAWFQLHQRYQDELLFLAVEKARIEVSKLESGKHRQGRS